RGICWTTGGLSLEASEYKTRVVHEQILLRATLQNVVMSTQLQQPFDPCVHCLLLRVAARCSKGVRRISGKSSRKISTIIGVVSCRHCNLIARIDLRHTTHCGNQTESQFQTSD